MPWIPGERRLYSQDTEWQVSVKDKTDDDKVYRKDADKYQEREDSEMEGQSTLEVKNRQMIGDSL